MTIRKIILTSLFAVFVMSFSFAQGGGEIQNASNHKIDMLKLDIQDQEMSLSYMLKDSDAMFFDAILNELKAGKKLRIQHNVVVYTSTFIPHKMGEGERSYFVSFDLLSDEFIFDEEDGNSYRTRDEDFVRAFLFTVQDLRLTLNLKMQKGVAYSVKFSSKYKPDGRGLPWYKGIALGYLQKSIKDKVVYIAK